MSLAHDLLVYIPLPQITSPLIPVWAHHCTILQSVRISTLFWQKGAVSCHQFYPTYLHFIMCTNTPCTHTHKFLILYAIHHCRNMSESMLDKDGRVSTIFSQNIWPQRINNGSLQAWLKNWLEVSQTWHLVSQCCWWRFKLLKYNVAASISRVQGVQPSWACSKSEDGGSISKNAGIYLPIYTLWYPRRPESILPQISGTSRKCINYDIMVQNNMQNGNFGK